MIKIRQSNENRLNIIFICRSFINCQKNLMFESLRRLSKLYFCRTNPIMNAYSVVNSCGYIALKNHSLLILTEIWVFGRPWISFIFLPSNWRFRNWSKRSSSSRKIYDQQVWATTPLCLCVRIYMRATRSRFLPYNK